MEKERVVNVRADHAVDQLEARIADKLGPQRYNVWFKNATRFDMTENFLRVFAPNHYVGEWIERNFGPVILEAAREITGADFELTFAIDPLLAKGLAKKQPDRQVEYITNNPDRVAREVRRSASPLVAPTLKGRLEDFIVGPSNALAHAAACKVAERPGGEYNPLFIHGGCGLGKSHLLQGICNALQTRHPSLRWRYVSGEEFMNDFVCAVKAREVSAFHKRYRQVDVLVIDDVHFLANKRATQEEFLHTVNSIDGGGKQLVLASDTHPKMIGHFANSLVSRFVAGMVVRIDSPDFDVRLGVLKRRAEQLKAAVPEAVLTHIAENFCANIRELEGALLKVVAQAHLTSQPMTVALAERAIRDLVRQNTPVVMLSDIESVVAIYFGLTPPDLHTSRKSRTVALARGISMYLARKHTRMSFPEIGRFMGNKNHSTVILACRRISKQIQVNAPASWVTPEGMREEPLGNLVVELEEQIGAAKRSLKPQPAAAVA